jgi:hypothetical protein
MSSLFIQNTLSAYNKGAFQLRFLNKEQHAKFGNQT